MEKYGLVLEGGGLRGAYTAGALAWLNDQGITFDYGVGISSGAVYLCNYWQGIKESSRNMAIHIATDPKNIGLNAMLSEHHYVAYQNLFKMMVEQEHFSVKELRESKANIEIGCYDLQEGKTIYFGSQDLDDEMKLLNAACALPVAAAIVNYQNRPLLDGGITKMIPIERSVEQGCTKHLIITTKPDSYIRKKASGIVCFLMKHIYSKYPKVLQDYLVRHINYYEQIGMIKLLINQGNGMLINPSKSIPISRFKGDPVNAEKLYELGYHDMQAQKEDILQFLKRDTVDPLVGLRQPVKEKVQ